MNNKIQTFLKTGLLERYLVGDTNTSETIEVESYIEDFPEVKAKYDVLQDNLEVMSKINATEPPNNILNTILTSIDAEETPVIPITKDKSMPWFGIAASVAALLFGAFSFFLFTQNQSLLEKNNIANEEINKLMLDAANTNKKLADLEDKYDMLNNPETNKYTLRGNRRAKNLKTVAYINPVEKLSMIDVVTLPELPEEQNYQLWAEVEDRMINLGILDPSEAGSLKTIPYLEDAVGYSITVTPKGNEDQSVTTENSVANISLQSENN